MSGHEDCGCFLVETHDDIAHAGAGIPVGNGGDAQPLPPRRMEVMRLELQEALLRSRRLVCLLPHDVKIEGYRRILVEGAHRPLASASHTDLRLCHAWPLLAERGEAANCAAALELTRGEYLYLGIEAKLQIPSLVTVENLAEGVLEHMQAEGVAHDHVAASLLRKDPHLMQTHLVQRAGEDVHGQAGRHGTRRHGAVVGQGLLGVLRVWRVLLEVQVRPDGLGELLAYNGAGADIARTTGHEEHSGTALGRSGLQQAQRHVQGRARAAAEAAGGAVLGPGVAAELIEQGVQRELALSDRHKEAPDGRVVLLLQAELERDLLPSVLL
mmetsp:Transcript_88958/g.260016  ORF Transcript_88958/g.260016 Transcript_88958/m.260016 type:complete len:327 (-) Transcript_88958:563-1543(-)